METPSCFRRAVTTVLLIVIVAAPILSTAQVVQGVQPTAGTDMMTAAADAERDARGDGNAPVWFMVGCIGGVLGVAVAYVVEPRPSAVRLMGRSPEYAAAYADTYAQRVKSGRTSAAWGGCIVGTLVTTVAYVALIAAANQSETTY